MVQSLAMSRQDGIDAREDGEKQPMIVTEDNPLNSCGRDRVSPLTAEEEPALRLVSVPGRRLDIRYVEVFRTQVQDLLEANIQIVVDFKRVEEIDSAAIGELVRLKQELEVLGGTLRLSSIHPRIAELLKRLHLDLVLDICETSVADVPLSDPKHLERPFQSRKQE